MKQMDLLRPICGLLAGALLLSCSKETEEPAGMGNAPARFSIGTRADAFSEGATFRIMAYYSDDNANKYGFKQTGTYYLKEENDTELTACSLSDDGSSPSDDAGAGLNGASGNCLLVFVSPGVKNNADGSFSVVPSRYAFLASAPEAKSVGGYGSIEMNNPLKDQRATVAVDFYKSQDAAFGELSIRELTLSGAGADGGTVTLFPASRQVEAGNGTLSVRLTDVRSDGTTNAAGNPLYYTTEESNRVHVAAAIYAPKEETAKYLDTKYADKLRESDYLYMNCLLTQDTRKDIPIRMSLTSRMPELEAQCHYTFNISVSSDYITATVDVFDSTDNEWQEGGSEGGEIVTPDYSVKLGEWRIVGDGTGWELVDVGDQTIGGGRNNG